MDLSCSQTSLRGKEENSSKRGFLQGRWTREKATRLSETGLETGREARRIRVYESRSQTNCGGGSVGSYGEVRKMDLGC